jgi:large repetitive protein
MKRFSAAVFGITVCLVSGSTTSGQTPGTVKWTLKTWSKYSSPAVAGDGTIYVSANDGRLVAVNPDGTVKWKCQMGDPSLPADVVTDPVIGSDGDIYSGSTWSGNWIYRVNPDGLIVRHFGSVSYSSPAIGYSGFVYVMDSMYGGLTCYDPVSGLRRWTTGLIQIDGGTLPGYDPYPSPSIGQDGSAYIASGDGTFRSFDRDGNLKWSFRYDADDPPHYVGDYVFHDARSNAAIGADGTVYFGANNKKFFAVRPDGVSRWQYTTGGAIWSEPAIAQDGTVYVKSIDAKLYAFRPDGTLKWTYQTAEAVGGSASWPYSSLAIGTDGTIYFGGRDSHAYAVNADGTLQWSAETDGGIVASPNIGPDGTVYMQTGNNTLYAFYSSSAGLADSPWPKYRGGAANCGRPRQDPRIAWQFDTGSNIQWSSPALADDGTVYIGSTDDSLVAVNPDGSRRWAYGTGGPIIASPSVGPDSTVYIGSQDKKLHAVNPDGTGKWTVETAGQVISTPAVSADGTVYVGSLDHKMYAVNGDGNPKWTFTAGSTIYSSPVIGRDSTIYFGSDDKNFYALRPDGTEKWRYTTGGGIGTSAAIDTDGTVYFGCGDYKFYALNPNGSLKWTYLTAWNIWSSPAIAPDGTIVLGLRDNKLLALNRDGTERWTLAVEGQVWSSPLIGADGLIYAGCHGGMVYAVSMDGVVEWKAYTSGEVWSSPNMSKDGVLYAGSRDGWLYAIRTGSGGLADAPWPKFRGDRRNSGSLQETAVEPPPPEPPKPGDVIWTYGDASAGFYSCPAVDPDGIIYAGSWDSTLVALNPDGTERWHRKIERSIHEPLVLGADGILYGAASDMLFAANPADGSFSWSTVVTDGKKFTSPSIGPDGSVFAGSEDGRVYAFDRHGIPQWSFAACGPVLFSPVIGTGGTLYAVSEDSLYARGPDGRRKWTVGTESAVSGMPALASDGTVYFGTEKNLRDNRSALVAIRPDGSMRFVYREFAVGISNSPVLSPDGSTLYYGDSYGGLSALNAQNGVFIKGASLNNSSTPTVSTPAIGSDGTIYIGSGNQFYYGLGPDLQVRWMRMSGYAVASPALTSDSTMMLACGRLTAVWTGSPGTAPNVWSKTKGDAGNTGSLLQAGFPVAAAASNDLYGAPGAPIPLDGSSSYDADHDPLAYLWECVGKPDGASVLISNPTAAAASARLSKHGVYRFRLTVSDGSDGSSSDFVTVHCGLKWKTFICPYDAWNEDHGALSYCSVLSPAIGSDGSVYTGSPWYTGELHALNPDGTHRWIANRNGQANIPSPVILEDGTIYHGGTAFTPDSVIAWSVESLPETRSWADQTPALGPDSVLYFGLTAVRPGGSIQWTVVDDSNPVLSDPVIGSDGVVYFGRMDGLEALNPDGILRWRFGEGGFFLSPAVGSDGTLYTATASDTLIALNPDGTLRWNFPSGKGYFTSAPVIGPDGTVYAGTSEGRLFAVRSDGSQAWAFDAGNPIGNMAIDSNGRIYFGSGNSLIAVDPDGAENWSYPLGGPMHFCGPSIAPDGTLYAVSRDGFLYAFFTGSLGLADSPWPKFHRDNRNTGRAPAAPDTNAVVVRNPDGGRQAPDRFVLLPNHPNPFNPETAIAFGLPKTSDVRIELYNAMGQRVRTLVSSRMEAGWHSVRWDGRDASGKTVNSGVYIVRITADRFEASGKMMMMK